MYYVFKGKKTIIVESGEGSAISMWLIAEYRDCGAPTSIIHVAMTEYSSGLRHVATAQQYSQHLVCVILTTVYSNNCCRDRKILSFREEQMYCSTVLYQVMTCPANV